MLFRHVFRSRSISAALIALLGLIMPALSSGSHGYTILGVGQAMTGKSSVVSASSAAPTQVFADDFTGSSVNTATWSQYAWSSTSGGLTTVYSRAANQITSSGLEISASDDNGTITTGGMDTASSFLQTYGQFAITFKATGNPGFDYAFDLYPASGRRPYINIGTGAAGGSREQSGSVWSDSSGATHLTYHPESIDSSSFNTLGVDWTPDSLTYTLNGRPVAEDVGAAVPTSPLMFALQLQPNPSMMDPGMPASAQLVVSSVTAEQTTAPAAEPANTVPMPTSNPAGFTEVASDDFPGTSLNRQLWTVYSEGHPNGDPADTWSAGDVSVADNQLTLSAHENADGTWTSAGINMSHSVNQTYGMYLVRMQIDPGQGVSSDANIWPSQGTYPPGQDFAETNGAPARDWVYGTFHFVTADNTTANQVNVLSIDASQWHTYGLEWLPGKLVFTVDGRVWATANSDEVPSSAMTLCLQVQAWTQNELAAGSWENPVNATTPSTVSMHIAWVAVYHANS